MKPLLILKTGHTLASLRAEGEDFDDWIRRGLQMPDDSLRVVDVSAGEDLPPPEQLCGVVVTGSPAMVTDREPWSENSAAWLRQAMGISLPILGICYGHQLLAHALGGQVDYHPCGREIGTVEVSLNAEAERDPLFANLPSRFPAHATHSQSVLRLPEHAVLLARSAHDSHHAFRVGEQAWGVQFHPEFDARIMSRYVHDRQQDLLAEGFEVNGLLQEIRETPEATRLLRDFASFAGSR